MDERFHDFERKVEDWHWWYQVRREILDQILRELGPSLPAAHAPAGRRLLDIGCGTGGSSLVMSRHGQVVGLDRARRSFQLSLDRPYRHRVVGTAERLPFGEGSFDVVAALDVLEHLDDDIAGAAEIRRVLVPGGAAVIFVPAWQILWGKNDEFSHHRRRYRRGTLRRAVEGAGLLVERLLYFNGLLFLPTLVARLSERLVPGAVGRLEYQDRRTLLNDVLAAVFRLEVPLLRRSLPSLPVGTSVCCVARRPA